MTFLAHGRVSVDHAFFDGGQLARIGAGTRAVMEAWPHGNFPVFEGHDHMQFQIESPAGFASRLGRIVDAGSLPGLPFCR